MTEIWEHTFKQRQAMWGFEPAHSAVVTNDFFREKGVKHVLVPGIGYGRNAQLFIQHGMRVTGIEVSPTAIELGRQHYGASMKVYQGSVTDMPFDTAVYDGIFCYALVHLLAREERAKLIQDCYDQLADGGYMVFTAISKQAHTYGKGRFISQDYYEVFDGIKMFFYDQESIDEEFSQVGLFETTPIEEEYPFFLIKCYKGSSTP